MKFSVGEDVCKSLIKSNNEYGFPDYFSIWAQLITDKVILKPKSVP